MGIYVFNREVLMEALDNDHDDFGEHIIPASLQKYNVFAYIFQEYWADIGTVRSFFEANLALTDPVFVEASVIAGLLVFNAVLGIFQESRAKATLAALKSRLALSASVRRDGAWAIIRPPNWCPVTW